MESSRNSPGASSTDRVGSALNKALLLAFMDAVGDGRRVLTPSQSRRLSEALEAPRRQSRTNQSRLPNHLRDVDLETWPEFFRLTFEAIESSVPSEDWARFDEIRQGVLNAMLHGSRRFGPIREGQRLAERLRVASALQLMDGLADGTVVPGFEDALAAAKGLFSVTQPESALDRAVRLNAEDFALVCAAPELSAEVRYVIGGRLGPRLLEAGLLKIPYDSSSSMSLDLATLARTGRRAMPSFYPAHVTDVARIHWGLRPVARIYPRPEELRAFLEEVERNLVPQRWVKSRAGSWSKVTPYDEGKGSTIVDGTNKGPGFPISRLIVHFDNLPEDFDWGDGDPMTVLSAHHNEGIRLDENRLTDEEVLASRMRPNAT